MKKITDIERAGANCECNHCGLTFLRCSRCRKNVKSGSIYCVKFNYGNNAHYCRACDPKKTGGQAMSGTMVKMKREATVRVICSECEQDVRYCLTCRDSLNPVGGWHRVVCLKGRFCQEHFCPDCDPRKQVSKK